MNIDRPGVNAPVISARLGHSTVAPTPDTCSHLLPDAYAEAAEKLAAMLGNGRPPEALAPGARARETSSD